jgi:hypothetical protein
MEDKPVAGGPPSEELMRQTGKAAATHMLGDLGATMRFLAASYLESQLGPPTEAGFQAWLAVNVPDFPKTPFFAEFVSETFHHVSTCRWK